MKGSTEKKIIYTPAKRVKHSSSLTENKGKVDHNEC